MELPLSLQAYISFYLGYIALMLGLCVKNFARYDLFTTSYWNFLFTPFKIGIFVIGLLALIIPVDILKLHSWDYFIALFQPILSYLLAPWSIATIYRGIRNKISWHEWFVALGFMAFASCWSVELYLLFRDGFYMPDWLINIPISITCFIVVGLFWNLTYKQGMLHFDWYTKTKLK